MHIALDTVYVKKKAAGKMVADVNLQRNISEKFFGPNLWREGI
jgi:hypothetical protein